MSAVEQFVAIDDGTTFFMRRVGDGRDTVVVPNGLYYLDDLRPMVGHASVLAYDLRHRGRTESRGVSDAATHGVEQDVEDLEAIRSALGLQSMALIAHSYVGHIAALYALRYPQRLRRAVLMGPLAPDVAMEPPNTAQMGDEVSAEVMEQISELRKRPASADPVEACRAFWSVLRRLYVYRACDAAKINWGRCELPQERRFIRYWTDVVWPSLLALRIPAGALAAATIPMLIIHGVRDRSSPFAGGRAWAERWGNARLLSVGDSAHAPWIEAPEQVATALACFLSGEWPTTASIVSRVDPHDSSPR